MATPSSPTPIQTHAEDDINKRRFDSADLFGQSNEIEITHAEAIYRLKITRQGKLILNK